MDEFEECIDLTSKDLAARYMAAKASDKQDNQDLLRKLAFLLLKQRYADRSDDQIKISNQSDDDDVIQTIVLPKNQVKYSKDVDYSSLDTEILTEKLDSVAFLQPPKNDKGQQGVGTAFLADVSGVGICLLSAGHNFEPLLSVKPDENNVADKIFEELKKYKIMFANLDGKFIGEVSDTKLKNGRAWNLKLFLDTYGVRGSIFYKGKSVVFKEEGKTRMQPYLRNNSGLASDSDFFAILLDEKIRQNLKVHGLGILACDPSSMIEKQEVVIICGHPWDGVLSQAPQVLSYGVQIDKKDKEDKGPIVYFDYDSRGGNSGSPVFDMTYKVKGIHVRGNKTGNGAMSIQDVKKWVDVGK